MPKPLDLSVDLLYRLNPGIEIQQTAVFISAAGIRHWNSAGNIGDIFQLRFSQHLLPVRTKSATHLMKIERLDCLKMNRLIEFIDFL